MQDRTGDLVPADLRLLKVHGLQIQEAILTGESVAVEKRTDPVAADAALGDRTCMAFSGTTVTSGQGMGVVVATGARTEIGRISGMLRQVQVLTTPLLRQMATFAKWLTIAIGVIAATTFTYYLMLVMVVFTIFVTNRLKDSRIGRAWMALREDEMNKILGIESATEQVGVAVGGHEGVIATFEVTRGRRHAEIGHGAVRLEAELALELRGAGPPVPCGWLGGVGVAAPPADAPPVGASAGLVGGGGGAGRVRRRQTIAAERPGFSAAERRCRPFGALAHRATSTAPAKP